MQVGGCKGGIPAFASLSERGPTCQRNHPEHWRTEDNGKISDKKIGSKWGSRGHIQRPCCSVCVPVNRVAPDFPTCSGPLSASPLTQSVRKNGLVFARSDCSW